MGTNTSSTTGRTRVTDAQIESFLNVEKGRTTAEIAEKFGVTAATAKKHLTTLVQAGKVIKAGSRKQPNGGRGRPSDLYGVPGKVNTAQA